MSDATPTVVADRYRLDELIGSGSMGEVWRGYDTRADWVVAVKVLGAEAAGSAAREKLRQHARAVAKVIHPNVAMVLDMGEHDGAPFLVMEYLTGLSLGEELAAGGPMRIVDVCDLIGQAAAGLDAAHRAGVVHGEVDPDSFRRAASGVLKVVGFGMDDPGPSTGPYVAPEGNGEPSADLYALGCVCYELLCGRPPFDGDGETGAEAGAPGAAGSSAGTGAPRAEPAPPSALRAEVPAELDRLVLAMIDADPARRPSGGEAIRRALAAIARPRADSGPLPASGADSGPVPVGGANLGPAPLGGANLGPAPLGGGGLGPAPVGGGGNPGAVPVTGAILAGGAPTGRGAGAGQGVTEVFQFGGPMGAGPGGGARAGDTAIYHAGDLEPEPGPSSNRKLFLQLGLAVAAIVVVTVAMVTWAGSRDQPAAVSTPTAAPTTSAPPTESPTDTPDVPTSPPTGDRYPNVVTTLPADADPPASLRETAPPKATFGPGAQSPPDGWGEWLRRFDEAVGYQERAEGINPKVAAKARQKIQQAARKAQEGKTDAVVGQIAELYRELLQAQQRGDMDPFGPAAEFMREFRIQER
ncbi:protein kinase domain-containing protein [Nonomuraea sp. SYSU D8015]|uniref:protein kinase domain-containing protein n=1 Tax=Nonomuraea sp. SYSU D8015 TaxID=2593644 RepID=UPI001660B7B5|nr:protein kinase [Nonomuraea sp. SYSU D8015]